MLIPSNNCFQGNVQEFHIISTKKLLELLLFLTVNSNKLRKFVRENLKILVYRAAFPSLWKSQRVGEVRYAFALKSEMRLSLFSSISMVLHDELQNNSCPHIMPVILVLISPWLCPKSGSETSQQYCISWLTHCSVYPGLAFASLLHSISNQLIILFCYLKLFAGALELSLCQLAAN